MNSQDNTKLFQNNSAKLPEAFVYTRATGQKLQERSPEKENKELINILTHLNTMRRNLHSFKKKKKERKKTQRQLQSEVKNVQGETFWKTPKLEFATCNGTPLQYSCLGNPMDGGA